MVIFLNMDGTAEKIEPQHVYQGSNNVTDVTVIAPYAATTAMEIGFILPNGLYWKNEQGKRYMPMFSVEQDTIEGVNAWTYSLTSSMTELVGELQIAINAKTANGNMTSYLCRTFVEESVLPDITNPPPDTDVYTMLQLYVARLDGRTANVPNLVASIQKVAPNAITYTDNSGVESAPIVIEGGETAPMPLGAASVVKIPSTAWQPSESGQTVTGYKYIVTAGLHGQMRDGATANDLWVSFDEADSAAFRGAYEDYTVDTAGNITISVTQPIAMTVRVWNGKGLVDEVARADIAAETARAQSAESDLQAQIDHIEDSGYDRTAREMIAAETERAEAAEAQLQQNIDAEKMRAEAAAEQLQERLQEQIGDLETSKVDVSGGTMNDKLVVKGNNFPHVQVLNTVEGLSGYFEQSGGSLDIIARDAEGENLSYISLEDGIVRSHAALYENDQRVYSPNNPPPTGEVSSVNGQTGAVEITPENIGAVNKSGDTLEGAFKLDGFLSSPDWNSQIRILPVVDYEEIDPTHTTEVYLKELLKWICRNYPNSEHNIWIGNARPNSVGCCIIGIYNTSDVNNEGLPRHSNGLFRSINADLWTFYTQDYNYGYSVNSNALPLSGGTLTGDLKVQSTYYPAVSVIEPNKDIKGILECNSSGSEFNIDLITRRISTNTNLSNLRLGDGYIDAKTGELREGGQRVYSPNNPPIGYIDLLNLRGTQGQHDVTLDNIGIGDTRIGIVLSGVYEYYNTYRVKFPSGGTYDGVYFSEQDKDYSVMRRAAGGSSFFLTGATQGGANGNYIGFFIYTRTA